MDLIYGLFSFILLASIVGTIVGLIRPSLFTRLLKSNANRKKILLLGSAVFIFSVTVVTITEPESVKQERLNRESQQQASKQTTQEQQPVEQAATDPEPEVQKVDPRFYWHRVVRVVDGDTVIASVDSKDTSIRIIGMDAPESTITKECFGNESSAKAKEFLEGKWIQLERDESQTDTDKYDRLLRYVWFDSGTDFGRRMIEEGYAFEYTYNTPYNKQAQYKETAAQAKGKQMGLWSPNTCAGGSTAVTPKTEAKPTPTPAPTPTPKPATPAPSSSGGVVKKSRNDICHAPGTTYYNRTTNYTSFNSLQSCLDSGGRLPAR